MGKQSILFTVVSVVLYSLTTVSNLLADKENEKSLAHQFQFHHQLSAA